MGRLYTLLLLALPALALADPTPVPVIPGDPLACFTRFEGQSLTHATGAIDGMPFANTLRLTTGDVPSGTNAWDIRARCFTSIAETKGNTLLATFWMRTLSGPGDKGYTTFVLEQNNSPYTKSVSFTAVAGKDWKKIEIPLTMADTYPANGYNFSFWVTFPNQEIEIGGLTVSDYGPNYPYSALNLTNWPYDGHALDAPWRAAAAARIEKLRKGDIVVVAKDDQGNPIPNAQVHVKMKRHAFGFGTAVAGDALMADTADGQKYRDTLKKYFNKVVTENALKWPPYESWGRAQADYMLPWFQANGFTMVRGHNVIWPGLVDDHVPADVAKMLAATPVDKDKLRSRINSHITDVVNYAKGRVSEWDVINEPIANNDVEKVLGRAELADWFKQTRAIDPAAKLYINEYNIVAAGGADVAHQNAFYDYIQSLIANGAPVDGLGVQSHFDTNLTPPDRVLEILDRFAAFGKDIQVTEFDVNINDEQVQADFTRDFMTVTFSHPAIKGFMIWGFWEGAHWFKPAAMFRLDWRTKPNFDVWNDLVFHQWWTDTTGTTDASGVFRARGFLGDYDIEVTAPGKSAVTTTLTLGSKDQPAYLQTGKTAAGSISAAGIGNAASYQTGSVAPGEIVVIFGSGIGPDNLVQAQYSAELYLPKTVADTQVLFDDIAAPLIYVSAGQTAAIVPYGVKDTTKIKVRYQGVETKEVSLPVAAAVPGIYTCGPNGDPVVFNFGAPEGNRNSCLATYQAPKAGDTITFFMTGEGQIDPPISDGQYPGTTFPKPVQPMNISFGGVDAPVDGRFVGMTYAGVTQINTKVPDGVPEGTAVPLTVSIAQAKSVEAKTPVNWKLLWSDEFNGAAGTQPDPIKWGYDLGAGGWGNAELETYTSNAENASMDGNGNLAIRALKTSSGGYTSARIKTQGKFDFTYGKVEVRAKIPYGQGIWPAIWMLGNDITTVGWPKCGEIDIMEYIGAKDPLKVYGTVHGPTSTGAHTSAGNSIPSPTDKKWYDDFHVYALEWSADSMKILVDGTKYLDVPSNPPPNGLQWVFQHPYFIILNVAVGGNWPGYPDSTTSFPATMLVDYVRVYQHQ